MVELIHRSLCLVGIEEEKERERGGKEAVEVMYGMSS
jgi:hypothetical protein